jgi:hypothetical protein
MPTMPATPPAPDTGSTLAPSAELAPLGTSASTTTQPNSTHKEPKQGDFDAGGAVSLPNGPNEDGKYATFNWVTVNAKARYFLLDSVTANFTAPIALIKPSTITEGGEMERPDVFGGFNLRIDAVLPMLWRPPGVSKDTKVGITFSGAYMREGAMLLSDKDFPLFTGGFQPGFTAGLLAKLKLSSLVDFSFVPVWVYQAGRMQSHDAVQIPLSLILAVGSLVKVSADLGIFTGDQYSFSADHGGRIYAGGALDVKISKIIVHAGAGVASLITGAGSMYPTIGDSGYIDLNVKYAK